MFDAKQCQMLTHELECMEKINCTSIVDDDSKPLAIERRLKFLRKNDVLRTYTAPLIETQYRKVWPICRFLRHCFLAQPFYIEYLSELFSFHQDVVCSFRERFVC